MLLEFDDEFELELSELFELELPELFDEEFELELSELFDDEFELELSELLDEEFELELLELFDCQAICMAPAALAIGIFTLAAGMAAFAPVATMAPATIIVSFVFMLHSYLRKPGKFSGDAGRYCSGIAAMGS